MTRLKSLSYVCWLLTGWFCSSVFCPSFAAPADQPQAGPITLELGLLGLTDHHESESWMRNEIRSFMAANPGITIEVTDMGKARENNEIEDYISLPRNIIGICTLPGYEVPYLVRRNAIVPIEQFLPDPEFSMDVFYDNLWEPVKFAGKTWGVPWATMVPLLVWSPALFAKAGVAGPPATWEEFIEDARLLTKDLDGDGKADQIGCAPLKPGVLGLLCIQIAVEKGVSLITDQGYAMYSEDVAEVLALVRKMVSVSNDVNSGGTVKAPYAMGLAKTASDLNPLRYPDCGLAPLPSIGQNRRLANLGSLYLAVRKSTPEEEAVSWKFIKWISRKDVGLPAGPYGYPVRKDIIEREDFRERGKTWFQNFYVPWEENQRLVDLGPRNVVGRFPGLKELVVSVQMGMLPDGAARTAWNTTAAALNSKLKFLKPAEEKQYELFK